MGLNAVIFSLTLLILIAACAGCENGQKQSKAKLMLRHPAAKVVQRYCQLDGMGAQLGWAPGFEEIESLGREALQVGDSPLVVIDGFRVTKVKVSGRRAWVIVRFAVIGTLSNEESPPGKEIWALKRSKKPYEIVTYQVHKKSGTWRIHGPVNLPHVLRRTVIRQLSSFVKEGNGREIPGRIESMRRVIRQLTKLSKVRGPFSTKRLKSRPFGNQKGKRAQPVRSQ